MKQRVAIAGASGFIGSHLISEIQSDYEIIALSRSQKEGVSRKSIDWRSCDLFSLKQLEEALRGARYAVYLVHSMLPSAGLTQGNFEDLDLIMADNFARACAANDVEQIIYLGGLIPRRGHLSRHLKSRREVEEVFRSHSTPVTILRAGMIIGPGGSSYLMLKNLVSNLPVLVLPKWTSSKTQPVSLWDVVSLLHFCIGNTQTYDQTFDIGMNEQMTYASMIRRMARVLSKKRYTISIPVFSPKISKLWVSLFSRAPYSLVSPLIDSLRHRMTVKDHRLQEMAGNRPLGFEEAVSRSLQEKGSNRLKQMKKSVRASLAAKKDVRSVQRLPLPPGFHARDLVQAYFEWLPKLFRWIVHIQFESQIRISFRLSFCSQPLLILELDEQRSTIDRQLLRIKGGLLDDNSPNGRLEFREALDGKFAVAAIHEFYPKVPWFLYQITQAYLHSWVMNRFRRHLRSLARQASNKLRTEANA